MLSAVCPRLAPSNLVALDIFFQRNPEPIHMLGEVRLMREGQGA
jgi:hypothetical protein